MDESLANCTREQRNARLPIRVRDVRRPTQCRQVVTRQRDLRSQDQHRVRQAPDHPAPHHGRAHPTRHNRSCSSTHPACTSRCRPSASGSTPPRSAASSDVDVTCLVLDATMPFGKGDRWVAEKLRHVRIGRDRQQDRHGQPEAGDGDAAGGERARRRRVLPGVGEVGRRRRAARRAPRHRCSPRARSTSPTTRCPTCPRSDGSPSSCASSCSP